MSFAPPPVIPPNNGAKVLVLSCIDPRFTEFLAWFLTHQKQVHSNYDLFVLAGSSLGVTQNRLSGSTLFPNWKGVFIDHLKIAISLHSITEVWVFDHLDCGAYKIIYYNDPTAADTAKQPHIDQLIELKDFLATYSLDATPSVNTAIQALYFKGFIMNTDGRITKVTDDGNGITVQDQVREGNATLSLVISALFFTSVVLAVVYWESRKL